MTRTAPPPPNAPLEGEIFLNPRLLARSLYRRHDAAFRITQLLLALGIAFSLLKGGDWESALLLGSFLLIMTPCRSLFYRKGSLLYPQYTLGWLISVGAVLRTPMTTGLEAEAMIDLLQGRGFEVLALTPSAEQTLAELKPGRRTALLLGSEGPGLPRDIIARCRPVGIRMAGGFDSLNVAATSAVALHHLTTAGAD